MDGKLKKLADAMESCILKNDQSVYRDLSMNHAKTVSATEMLLLWNGGKSFSDLSVQQLKELHKRFLKHYPDIFEPENKYFDRPADGTSETDFINKSRKDEFVWWAKENCKDTAVIVYLRTGGKSIESFFKKDLCDLNKDEAIAGLSNLKYYIPDSIRKAIHSISVYAEWCRSKVYIAPQKIAFETIKASTVPLDGGVAKHMIMSPSDLVDVLETVSNLDEGRYEVIALCLAWLGIDTQEAISLRNEEVDTLNGIITVSESKKPRTIDKIPDGILNALQKYVANDQVVDGKGTVRELDDLGYFLKRRIAILTPPSSLTGRPLDVHSIRNGIVTLSSKYSEISDTNREFDTSAVMMSGKMFRLSELEFAGEDITDDIIADIVCVPTGTKRATIVRDMRALYEAYKRVKARRNT